MELETTVYTWVILFSAYLMRGIAGFGSALIAVPLLALMFPLTLVVPLVVLLDYLGSATQGFRNRQRIVWGDLAPLIPFTIIGVATSLILLNAVNSKLLSNVLGGFVILYAIYQTSPLARATWLANTLDSLRISRWIGRHPVRHHQMLMALLASIPIAGIALFVGGRVHTTISQQTFVKLISLLLVTSGSALLLKG